jgi:hypothetical protein
MEALDKRLYQARQALDRAVTPDEITKAQEKREPSREMIASSRRATVVAKPEDTRDYVWRQMWRSMIDALLAETQDAERG